MSDDGKMNIPQLIRENNPFDPDNVVNIYHYGSHVYGTNDEESDIDIVMVTRWNEFREYELQFNTDKLSCTVYSGCQFVHLVREHDISALECIWLPDELKVKEGLKFAPGAEARWAGMLGRPELPENTYALDIHRPTLRKEISGKSSNSFVKAKKKFEVEAQKQKNLNAIEWQYRIGKKSLFHALRIVMFGIQLASEGKITNYQCANEFWERIKSNPSRNWGDYKKIYQPIYNGLMTEFRRLAPKK